MSDPGADTGPATGARRVETAALIALVFARLLWSGSIHQDAGFLNNALLALVLAAVILRRPRPRLPGRALAAGAALYFAAAFISVYFSIAPWSSLRWFLFRLGDLFLLLLAVAAGKGRLRVLAGAMVAAVALSAAYALRQRLGGFEATIASGQASQYALETLREGRVFGLTFSPDMLAAMIAGLIPVLLSFIASGFGGHEERGWDRVPSFMLLSTLLALFLCVLIFTRSVGGFLAAGAGVGAWVFFHARRGSARADRRAMLLAAIGLVILLAGAGAIVALRGGHLFELDSPHNPLLRRLDNWATALQVWREFPLTGAGEGQAGLAMLLHRSLSGNEAKHAHNALIEALAETGPLGLVGLGLILAGFFINALKLRPGAAGPGWFVRTADAEHEMAMGLAAGGAAVALHAMMDFDFAVMEAAAIFWVACAAVIPVEQAAARPRGGWSTSRRAVAAAALLVTALAELYQARGAQLRGEAEAAFQADDGQSAESLAARALAWDPTTDETYQTLGLAGLKTHADKKAAMKEYEAALLKAISVNPRNPFYYKELGMVYTGMSDYKLNEKAAGEMFAKAVALYPNSLDLNVYLGRWLRGEGRYEEAEKVLKHAAECQAYNGWARFELGLLYLAQGRDAEAWKCLEQGVWQRPIEAARAVYFAQTLLQLGKKKEAREFLERWDARYPGEVLVQSELGRMEKEMEKDTGP